MFLLKLYCYSALILLIINQKIAWFQVRKRENYAATFHRRKYSHQLILTNPSADRLDAPITPQNTPQYKHILTDATISRLGPIISPIILTGIPRSRHVEQQVMLASLMCEVEGKFEKKIVLF